MTIRLFLILFIGSLGTAPVQAQPSPDQVLAGLKQFFAKTARPDGSFTPGIDPKYLGMSDSAYSDLAAVTYAVTLHKTFGWKLPYEDKTIEFLIHRQRKDGSFFNVAGTVDPNSPEGKTYNTTQGLVALRALGVKPRYNPLGIFEEILKADYKSLPAYTTSFFPLAYLCYGQPIPAKADRGIRALMVQDETGYTNDHIAATFHASHYYHLVGEPTPRSQEMVARILRDQKQDGSWLLNLPSRDRHATFDAVFTLHHEGPGRKDCRQAIERAARWALSCRNEDGGFGHYPGSTSDADANYFQVGTLVMAGYLRPVDPLPKDPHLLSWGHLMPVPPKHPGREFFSARLGGWVGSVDFSHDGKELAAGSSDGSALLWDIDHGTLRTRLQGHKDAVACIRFAPDDRLIATGSYDHTIRLWPTGPANPDAKTLEGHRGAVLSIAFHPHQGTLASGSIDGTIKLWDVRKASLQKTLAGHRSWVNAVAYHPEGGLLASGSSDGTIRLWTGSKAEAERVLFATKAEVRCVAFSPDGRWLAAGLRYGGIKVWDTTTWKEHLDFQGHESDVWAIVFTNSKTLATANGDWNRAGHVKLWEVSTGRNVGSFQHTGEVMSLAVSPEGRRLAAGAGDRMIRAWKLGD